QTMERLAGLFSAPEQPGIRERLTRMIRCVISQRLIPRKQESGSVAVFEILKSGSSFEDALQNHAGNPHRDSGVRGLETQIANLLRDGIITEEAALAYAPNVSATAIKSAGQGQ